MGQQRDYYNIQGYDLHGDWETQINHDSSLFDHKEDPAFCENLYVDCTIESYLRAAVPPQKLVLGIPTYGYGWTGVPNKNDGRYQDSTAPATPPNSDFPETPGIATYLTISSLTGYTRHSDCKRIAVWLYDPSSGMARS